MKKKFCRRLLSLALTGMAFLAQSQNPLKVGDALPKQFWETPLQMVNTPQKTTTLSADKDKLIILDFWNTWCSACILNFPKMEELQKQFGDKIKILAVSNQDRATLEKFFASKNGSKYNSVKSIADDKLMHKLFPHRGVPYIIWVKDGKLLNSTDAGQVNEKTITEILSKSTSSLQTVIQMSRDRPLFLSEDFDREKGLSMVNYSLLAKGRLRGMGFGSGFHRSGQVVYGRQFTNLSLLEIFSAIADEIFQQHKVPFNEKRRLIEAKDPLPLYEGTDSTGQDQNLYSYEYVVPVSKADSLYQLMLNNLAQFTNYSVAIEKRKVQCLVLKRTSAVDKIKTKFSVPSFMFSMAKTDVKNSTVYSLINSLDAVPSVLLPIVDETGYNANIDITMGPISDLPSIERELSRFDLGLVEAEREIDILIIKDKKPN